MPCASSRSSAIVVLTSARSSSSISPDLRRLLLGDLLREAELHREGDEVLLRPVVEVALDRPA